MKARFEVAVSMLLLVCVGVIGWTSWSAPTDGGATVEFVDQTEGGVLLDRPSMDDLATTATGPITTTPSGVVDGIATEVRGTFGAPSASTPEVWSILDITPEDVAQQLVAGEPMLSVSPEPSARTTGGIQAATVDVGAQRGPRTVLGPPTTTTTTTQPAPTTTPTTTPSDDPPPNPTTTTPTGTTTPPATTTPPSTSFDLSLDRFYVNQAVPVLDTARPAAQRIRPVGRRGGLARAFVSANQSNDVRPEVELHWRHPNGTTGVIQLAAPSSTPTSPSEAVLGTTFNQEFGSNVLLPGTQVFVVVDPRNQVPEADETNNRWPAQGWVDAQVADIPEFEVTWIPVVWNGVQGNIGPGNVAQFEDRTMRMMPIPGIDSEFHAPVVFNGDLRTGEGWSQLLNQIAQLRAAEGSNRAYHAIVRRPSGTGIAGIAFRGFEAAVSMDSLSAASDVVAHEFGHNFGLRHAPCGPAAGADPVFPYSNARIGSWGYDIVGDVAYDPSSNVRDVMSYCDPTWISDYNFNNVLQNRLQSASQFAQFAGSALHVSGAIVDDVATIAPAYALEDGGVRPTAGRYTLVGRDSSGGELFATPFTTHQAELNGGPHDHTTEHFSFSVPATSDVLARLTTLTVELDGRSIGERRSETTSFRVLDSADQQVNADGTTTIVWDADAEIAIVRDATTDEVLAVSDSGSADIVTTETEVEVVLSDGMGSMTSEMVAP